ncbi:MAG: glycosyltransferase [Candidatus Omnitrophica bacterium]|nr:glycosyltransferase [Candidatus Omnitrophota bacterium]
MKIFYVSVIEKHAGWGSEYFINKSLRNLGHETYCVDYRKDRYRLYRHFINAPDCDAFLLQRGDYFPIPLIRAIRAPRFFLTTELVSRCQDQERLLKSGLFDHIFLHTRNCVDTVISRNWAKPGQCSLLLLAFDENLHRKIPGTVKDIDLLFVGWLSKRRKIFLKKISSQFNCLATAAYGEDLVRLANRAKIVLNIHAEDFPDTETRVFETLGCGSFLLSEQLSSENPFSELELVQFRDTEGLMKKIRYFLDHAEEREAIAEQGHAAALKNHTYTQRARQIVETMSFYRNHGKRKNGKIVRRGRDLRIYALAEPFIPVYYTYVKRLLPLLRKIWRN